MEKKIAVISISLAILFSLMIIVIEMPLPISAETIWVDDSYQSEDATHKKTIQAGVDAAQLGDTVHVHSGIYYENIIIDTTIDLIGEDKNTTIIDGNDRGHVIELVANTTSISGLTIRNHETIVSILNDGVYINRSSENIISNNIIYNCHDGINLIVSDDNLISSNRFLSNVNTGTYFWYSNNNTFIENKVSSIEAEIFLWHSNNNTFFHNNFIGINPIGIGESSINNIWDDGYSSGGNYWDDYTGNDEKSGPNQNEPGSDSIGDTPYQIINSDYEDRYPLMSQYGNLTDSPTPSPTPPSTQDNEFSWWIWIIVITIIVITIGLIISFLYFRKKK